MCIFFLKLISNRYKVFIVFPSEIISKSHTALTELLERTSDASWNLETLRRTTSQNLNIRFA